MSEPKDVDWLKRVRHQSRMNQEQMAEHLGVGRSYYNQIERGKKPLSQDLIRRAKVMESGVNTYERSPSERAAKEFPSHPVPNKSKLSDEIMGKRRVYPVSSQEPTAEDCINYLRTWLNYASVKPGMTGYAWVQLNKTFPLGEVMPELPKEEE